MRIRLFIMKDLLGNDLKPGDVIILATRSTKSGYAALKVGIVLNPSIRWGKHERVLIHSLDPRYLKYKKQNPAHKYRGAYPENIIKIAPETVSKDVLGALGAIYDEYRTKRIKVRDMARMELEEQIKSDVENV